MLQAKNADKAMLDQGTTGYLSDATLKTKKAPESKSALILQSIQPKCVRFDHELYFYNLYCILIKPANEKKNWTCATGFLLDNILKAQFIILKKRPTN